VTRDEEIIQLVAIGWKNQWIAWRLGTTENAIKMVLRRIYEKTGVASRLELCVRFWHCGGAQRFLVMESERKPKRRL
jgi:DNA-binding NarL/FixJ family response regulator